MFTIVFQLFVLFGTLHMVFYHLLITITTVPTVYNYILVIRFIWNITYGALYVDYVDYMVHHEQ